MHLGPLAGTSSGAHFSMCRTYRWLLWRTWDLERPPLVWLMLNPSTADGIKDDPTIRMCVAHAKALDYGGIEVVNLFALVSSDPEVLLVLRDPIGWLNDAWLRAAAVRSDVVAAWGAHPAAQRDFTPPMPAGWTQTNPKRDPRSAFVCRELETAGARLFTLGLTKEGHPKHPLARGKHRVPIGTPLQRFSL